MPAPLQHVHDAGAARRRAGGRRASRPGSRRCAPGRVPRERMWKLSRHDAERRVVGRLDDPPRVVVLVDVAAPGERLVGDPQAALGGALGERAQLLGGEVVVVDRRRGETLEQTSIVVAPSALHDVELRLGAAQVAREPVVGRRPRSRGTAGRGRCSGRARRRGGGRRPASSGEVMRSASKSSTPSKPAAAAAASFSSSVPLRQTVAIGPRVSAPRAVATAASAGRARRSGASMRSASGLDAGEERERARGLEDRHRRRRRGCGSRARARRAAARSRAAR